jgi:hypothetical protein
VFQMKFPGLDEAVAKMEQLVELMKEATCLRAELFGRPKGSD